MARIRSIKPAFFRDEDLQDLERAHPGKFIMLVFSGLWCQCDKAGNFEWKPRSLKLDILPFLDFDMEETLRILTQAHLIERYSVDGKDYGNVPKFLEHQRISGKEAQDAPMFPGKQKEKTGKRRRSIGEAPETAGREGNGVQEGKGEEAPIGAPPSSEIDKAFRNYNLMAENSGLAKAEKLTSDRRKKIGARLKDHSLEAWNRALEAVELSPFLLGQNDRGWRADLDFMCQPDSFNRIIEGFYANKGRAA